MYNYVMLVGRLTKDPVIKEVADGKKVLDFTLAVNRGFRNYEGEEQIDFIPVTVWEYLAEATFEYLKKGKMLLIKGMIVPKKERDVLASGVSVQNFYIQATKVVFLSSTNKNVEA